MASPPVATSDYASACTRVGDFDVTYLTSGEGPEVVILLHGFGAWSEVVWAKAIPALAGRYRVIAPDLIGFGLSSKPAVAFFDGRDPLEPEVRFLAAFMDAIGVERATLVGNSFGGGVALRMAATMPERVTRLVLVNSMGLGRSIHYAYKALALPVLGSRLVRPDRERIRRMWRYVVHEPALVTDAIVERNFELLSEPGAVEVIAAARLGVNMVGQKIHLAQFLPRVRQPTLLLWGKQDRIFPLRHAHRAKRRLPHAELVVLDPCGHVPPLERPDAFNRALAAFLDRSAAPGVAPVDASVASAAPHASGTALG